MDSLTSGKHDKCRIFILESLSLLWGKRLNFCILSLFDMVYSKATREKIDSRRKLKQEIFAIYSKIIFVISGLINDLSIICLVESSKKALKENSHGDHWHTLYGIFPHPGVMTAGDGIPWLTSTQMLHQCLSNLLRWELFCTSIGKLPIT